MPNSTRSWNTELDKSGKFSKQIFNPFKYIWNFKKVLQYSSFFKYFLFSFQESGEIELILPI